MIEATPKTPEVGQGDRSELVLGQTTGMIREQTTFLGERPLSKFTTDNVQHNIDLDASLFEFKAPEGVEVRELP